MKRTKMLLSATVLALALGIFMPAALYANEVSVTIDGVLVEFEDQGPAIVDGRTLVPVRGVFEALGFYVDWDQDAQTATLTASKDVVLWAFEEQYNTMDVIDVEVIITIGNEIFTTNGEEFELDVPAQLVEGRTMLPIRHVLESVGHFVDWDDDTSTVIIRNLWGFIDFDYTPGALENQIAPPAEGELFAVIHTNFGEIHLRLFPDLAPLTVENFVTHAQNGYYDGVIFHRVIDWFMIQGGDPTGTGTGGESIWDMAFGDEGTSNLRHIRGALSMANAGPNTNGSQFFIVQIDSLRDGMAEILEERIANQDEIADWAGVYYREVFPASFAQHLLEYGGVPHLDFRHTVFGQVFIGMDVVDNIAATEVDETARPFEDVIIERIEILTFGQ
ncbi:MAG: peptidylprolyl isomerase [Clostridiales bacterium]|jgi:peptidyl-prolyl cis-trans isomerase B (cyclophilin B)|nr:peptidylprolyl isomerase [Clostridiales bacterium]